MSKLQFTPEDFSGYFTPSYAEQASKMANLRLDKWLSEAVRVYGGIIPPGETGKCWFMDQQTSKDTHTALLVAIEPIKRECEIKPGSTFRICPCGEPVEGMYPCPKCKRKCGEK